MGLSVSKARATPRPCYAAQVALVGARSNFRSALARRERWIAPLALFITLVLALSTSSFQEKRLGFPDATWETVFLMIGEQREAKVRETLATERARLVRRGGVLGSRLCA